MGKNMFFHSDISVVMFQRGFFMVCLSIFCNMHNGILRKLPTYQGQSTIFNENSDVDKLD